MKASLRQSFLTNVAWALGVILALTLAIGGPALRFRIQKARVAELQAEVQNKINDVVSGQAALEFSAELETANAALSDWTSMADSGSQRVTALSEAAAAEGLNIVRLRHIEQEDPADGIMRRSHQLMSVGELPQLARFFDSVYALPGMASIDELQIELEDDGSEELQAALRLSWFAPGVPTESSEEAP